jgi:hypothetical protein
MSHPQQTQAPPARYSSAACCGAQYDRLWYNRRAELDLDSLISETLARSVVHDGSTSPAVEAGVEDFVQYYDDFNARLCPERFVLSFASVPDSHWPPHLRFLSTLRWVQTMNHSLSTLSPSFTAIDPRDGQSYTLYDHVVLAKDVHKETLAKDSQPKDARCEAAEVQPQGGEKEEEEAHDGGSNYPRFTASAWLLARDTPSSTDKNVLLAGYKYDGGPGCNQVTAPRCSLCPWSCPCLVDKWVCEADGTQLQSAARMSHVYVHLEDLLRYTKAPVDQHTLPPDTKALLPLTHRILGFEMRCVHLIVHTDGTIVPFLSPHDAGDTPANMRFALLPSRSDGPGARPAIITTRPRFVMPIRIARSATLELFYEFLRVTLNDALVRVLVYPYCDTLEPYFDLPEHFVYDLFNPEHRARALPILRQRSALLFPTFITEMQRRDLAFAVERNWAFLRAGKRPPCLLLLTPEQLALCTLQHLHSTGSLRHVSTAAASGAIARMGMFNPPRRYGHRHTNALLSANAMLHAPPAPTAVPVAASVPPRPRFPTISTFLSYSLFTTTTTVPASAVAVAAAPAPAALPPPLPQQPATSSAKRNHHRTKAQRKAAQRTRLAAEKAQADKVEAARLVAREDADRRQEQADLVEALHRSILDAEEKACAEERERRIALTRVAEAAAAERARAEQLAVVLDAVERLEALTIVPLHDLPPLQQHVAREAVARFLRADSLLWEPLLRQGQEHPDDDRAPIDAACGVCLEVFDLVTRFPLQSDSCARTAGVLLCNPCCQAVRDRRATALLRRAERKRLQQETHRKRRLRAARSHQASGAESGASDTDDDDALARRFPLPPCICSADHPFDPHAWHMASDWVGRRWAATHFGFTGGQQ